MGTLQTVEPNDSIHIVKLDTNNGMSYYGLMRTKDSGDGRCKASITFSPHSDEMEEVDPEMSKPTIEDGNDYEEPFDRIGDTSRYDMEGARIAQERLKKEHPNWFTGGMAVENKVYEIYREGRVTRMTGNELHSLIKESVKKVVKESLYGDYSRYAFNNAKNLKDFDRLRHSAEIEGEDEAELALTNHPQSNSNFYSHEYANGNLGLDDLEDDAKLSKEMYGI
jgi:hypothetical protein